MKVKDPIESCGGVTKEHEYLGHFTKSEHLSRGHNSGGSFYPTNPYEEEERPGPKENRLKGDLPVLDKISHTRNNDQLLGGQYGLYSESDRIEDSKKIEPRAKAYAESIRRQRGK